MANCYPKQLKAEMGNGYSGCMMVWITQNSLGLKWVTDDLGM